MPDRRATIIRLFADQDLFVGGTIVFTNSEAHRLRNVLKLGVNSAISLFNSQGLEYSGKLIQSKPNRIEVLLSHEITRDTEPVLNISLVQSISKGQRMEYTVQKATELGVSEIIPVMSSRTVVRLNRQRADKKVERWKEIARHAAEQCVRTKIPHISEVLPLQEWLNLSNVKNLERKNMIVLQPGGVSFKSLALGDCAITLVCGPEGGFEPGELTILRRHGGIIVSLGSRTLRTETASICALSIIQALWGDF